MPKKILGYLVTAVLLASIEAIGAPAFFPPETPGAPSSTSFTARR